MFTPYNLQIPTVLFPVKEVPLFTHQPEQSTPHQNEPWYDSERASTKSSTKDAPKDTPKANDGDDHNEWSTLQQTPSAQQKQGWLHQMTLHWPHPHLPHPHVDLSYLRRHKVVIPPTSTTTTSDAASATGTTTTKDSNKPEHHPYLPSSPFWPSHLFPASSPFHHHPSTALSNAHRQLPPTATGPYIPAATVIELLQYYVLELDAPGLAQTDTSRVSANWMSPRTILVSGESRRAPLPLNDDEDGGELVRTPTREEVPPESLLGAAQDENENERQQAQKVLFAERPTGPWRRSFVLPSDAAVGVDPSEEVGGEGHLRLEVEDGVVRVWVPKRGGE